MNRQKIRKILFYILPYALFFADFPKLNLTNLLGITSMNVELSALILYLVIFGLISLPDIWKYLLKNRKNKAIIAALTFMLYISLSVIWSLNKTRGILTAGISWVIFCTIISTLELFSKKESSEKILRNFFRASLAASAIAIIQMMLDVFGIKREVTQLCTGCVYSIFGFPHANGFFAEPQFFGNIIAIAAILANYQFVHKKEKRYLIYSGILTTTLFLTLSRGAIYSFILASIIFGIAKMLNNILQIAKIAGVSIAAILVAFLLQGTMSQLSATEDTFADGIRKPIEQLSLGKIKLEDKTPPNEQTPAENQSHFEGYVAQSTDVRTLLSEVSVATWKDRLFFGAGIGGSGQAIYNKYHDSDSELLPELQQWGLDTPKIITQNSYTEVLLELGIVGATLLAATLSSIIAELKKTKSVIFYATYAIFGLASITFFSGITNTIHLYILPALLKPHKSK